MKTLEGGWFSVTTPDGYDVAAIQEQLEQWQRGGKRWIISPPDVHITFHANHAELWLLTTVLWLVGLVTGREWVTREFVYGGRPVRDQNRNAREWLVMEREGLSEDLGE